MCICVHLSVLFGKCSMACIVSLLVWWYADVVGGVGWGSVTVLMEGKVYYKNEVLNGKGAGVVECRH